MNVKQLRESLTSMSDDTQVVLGGHDHSYYGASSCSSEAAELMPDGHMAEYWDDANMSYPDSKKILVVVIQ